MSREYVLKPFQAPVDLQIDYAKELNAQQLAAVTASPGPALVIAGAGSGKTRTLTYRVAYLLEHGVPADRILLLTFTNKAAREMMRRVNDLLGQEWPTLWGGTFHSIGARVLRLHATALGYRPDFTILDREDSNELLKTCLAEAKAETTSFTWPKVDDIADMFSMAANTRRPMAAPVDDGEEGSGLKAALEDLARRYVARKRACNVMDFDDLLVKWLELIQTQPDVAEVYQRRFQFILVDEYQDTNQLQSDLIDLLAARHKNVMVVGDDSQSIYSWRGANFRNILEFPKRYPTTAIYKIETNYRSTPEILNLANAVILENAHQFEKTLTPSRSSGSTPALVVCGDAGEQAQFVAQRALELRDQGVPLREMAVLYRSHFHALELQLELTRRNIPFAITSGIRFFEQAHIKDVSAYLKLLVNPTDELAFKRIVQLLPGIAGKGADRLWQAFQQNWSARAVAAWDPEAAETPAESGPEPTTLAAALQQCARGVPKKSAAAWANLAITFSQMEDESVREKPADLIRLVLEASYDEYLKHTFTNHRQRRDELEQLAVFALQFSSVEEFLTQLALLANVEAEGAHGRRQSDDEQIRLTTIHQAKGLEFDVVFVIMMCDGLFPSSRALEIPEAEEEERRLFYVAITRARTELYLSYPLVRIIAGQRGDLMQTRSRFLKEFPAKLVTEWDLTSFRPYG